MKNLRFITRATFSSGFTMLLLCTFGCSGVGNGGGGQVAHGIFAYVVVSDNAGNGSIAQFQMATDGTLTTLGPALSAGQETYPAAVDPSGKYLFAANFTSGTIQQFVIATDGTLSANAVPTISTGNYPSTITFTPNGRFALVAVGYGGTLNSYSLGPTGTLTLASSAPTGNNPSSVAVDQSGSFAYVTSNDGSTITGYRISSVGTLVPLEAIAPPACSSGCIQLVISPKGSLYALNEVSATVTQFSIDSSTGVLSAVNTYPAGPSHPAWISFDPSGNFAYVINQANTLSQFTVDSDGGLIGNGLGIATPFGPSNGAVDPSGKFFFFGDLGQTGTFTPQISQFVINSDGTLTSSGTLPLGANQYPGSITFMQR